MALLIFVLLFLTVFGKMFVWSLKAAWSISKIVFTIVFMPIILIAIVCSGFIYLAIGMLVIGGIVTFVRSAAI